MSYVDMAFEYAKSGLSVLPVVLESKKPTIRWSELQKRIATDDELVRYFTGLNGSHGVAVVCGKVSGGLEVLDFDNHFGDIEGVCEEFQGYEEVRKIIEKYSLPFEKSANGGYHLFYRCDKIEGSKKLAERRNEKTGNKLETLIETRGEGGYVIVSPSSGYELLSGNGLDKIGKISETERSVLHSYARTFCKKVLREAQDEKSAHNPKLKRVELGKVTGNEERETIPRRYNREATEEEIRGLLTGAGWAEIGTNKDNYIYRRPGKKDGASATFNGTVFYCFSSNGSPFEEVRGYSKYDVFLKLKHDGDWRKAYDELTQRFGIQKKNEVTEETTNNSIGVPVTPTAPFFVRVWTTENGQTRSQIDYAGYEEFLAEHGFRKFKRNREFILVRVVDNLVEEVEISDIQSFIKDYIWTHIGDRRLINVIIEKDSIWSKTKLNFMRELEDDFMTDNRDEGWLYFRNFAFKVSRDSEPKAYQYKELPKPIWKKKRMDRDLDLRLLQDGELSEIEKFITNVSKGKEGRKFGLMRAIGYLLHQYKDPSNAKVIVFQDEEIPAVRGMANGGTGKSLIARFIATYKKVAYKGANLIQKEKTEFLFDTVGLETEIVQFDDAGEHFPFDLLFSYVTGDLEVNKKYEQRFVIPKEKSPKFLITTNYTVGHIGFSHERRKHTIEFSNYYGAKLNPQDEFGHNLIDDWDSAEQHRADRFAIRCLRMFLQDGLREECVVNAKIRLIYDKVGREFAEFFVGKMRDNTIIANQRADKKALFDLARLEVDELSEMTLNAFTRKIKLFCEFTGIGHFEKRSNDRNYIVLVGDLDRVRNIFPKNEISIETESFLDDRYQDVM